MVVSSKGSAKAFKIERALAARSHHVSSMAGFRNSFDGRALAGAFIRLADRKLPSCPECRDRPRRFSAF
jgi:hypothetical protein